MSAKPTPRPKAPGRNIRENERSGATEQKKFRLPPETIEDIKTLAARRRTTESGLIADLVERAMLGE